VVLRFPPIVNRFNSLIEDRKVFPIDVNSVPFLPGDFSYQSKFAHLPAASLCFAAQAEISQSAIAAIPFGKFMFTSWTRPKNMSPKTYFIDMLVTANLSLYLFWAAHFQ